MATGFFKVPTPINEPVKSYAPGSPEREELQRTYKEMKSKQIDVPMYIGGDKVYTTHHGPPAISGLVHELKLVEPDRIPAGWRITGHLPGNQLKPQQFKPVLDAQQGKRAAIPWVVLAL